MDELECMRDIDERLQALAEDSMRARVASWISAKYLGAASVSVGAASPRPHGLPGGVGRVPMPADGEQVDQIPGIAKKSQSGEVQLTVRDLKARSANDAAVRLVHVLIWASQKLTGKTSVSSKHVVVPCLKKYRCYDGNTRGALAQDKGLTRDGDELSLDFHAEQLASKFADEILDVTVEGRWKPGATKRRGPRNSPEPRIGIA